MKDHIRLYEELSLNALPALQTQFYDGWVLRFTSGYPYTNRANSVNLLYPSTFDLQEKIAECERRYFGQGLPAVFKITDGADAELDRLLDERGYAVMSPTYLMTADLTDAGRVSQECHFTDHIDGEWLNAYFTLNHYTDEKKIAIATEVFGNIQTAVLCGTLRKHDQIVACGLCVLERGYAGLYNITVDEPQRGKGYGTELCASLASAAQKLGARTAYLQVTQNNTVAINLYAKLGYKTMYSYWYRLKEITTK